MSTKQKDTSNTQDNAENNHKLKFGDQLRTQENMPKPEAELNTAEPIENSPFIIRCINNEWLITMGDQAITHKHKTKEEALQSLDDEKWMVITCICTTIFRQLQKIVEQGRNIDEEIKLSAKIANEDTAG